MAFFNYVTKEITLKVVYYGPGLSGKTTNLQHLYAVLDPSSRGKFISLATEADRTLFFDFLPVDLGKINDFTLRFQLYTVPGQIRYNATRKLVLKGADAVVFVADSQREMRQQNIESFGNMRENLVSNNIDADAIPVVLQYNKRDLPNILSVYELNNDLNMKNYLSMEAEAVNGRGVLETFHVITKTLLQDISKKHRVDIPSAKDEGIAIKIQERDSFEVEEEIVAPETEEIVESVFAAQPMAPEAPQPSDERMDAIAKDIAGISESLLKLSESLAKMNDAFAGNLSEITQSLTKTRDILAVLSTDANESRRQQADIIHFLKEIQISLTKIKMKKGWFRFS